jgi:membrane associated rhomboid family serine protease
MLLIPLKHENMQGRRWPVITFGLIALNLIIFLGTHWTMERQQTEFAEVRVQLLLLAAVHPELRMPEDVEQFVTDFQESNPEAWKQASTHFRGLLDPSEARTRSMNNPEELQSEMDALAQKYRETQDQSILLNYGFVPAHTKPITYLTSIFLHAGWIHLIGNMWFLWLAGFILEENWGRVIYPVFYLFAGIAASVFHAGMYPRSSIPCLGASGAVAALMGAFLVRFPKLKIDMWGVALFIRFRFKAKAYWLLPLWLLSEIFYGTLAGQTTGVAHWAHVGGFIFGAIAALVIQHTGLEQKANAVIDSKVGWTADPAIVQGTALLEKGKLDEAVAILKKHLVTKPEAVDAYTLLHQLYWRKSDLPASRDTLAKLCQLHLKAQDGEAAWRDYEEYVNMGGDRMPAETWLELGRLAESQENYERAVTEYENLAKAYPGAKQSLLALLSAGRLALKKLNRPSDAMIFYKAAAVSRVPHADWDSNIQNGIRDAQKALAGSTSPVALT